MADIAPCFAFTMNAEGGSKFTNDPYDAGGPTKWGVTIDTLDAWFKEHGRPPATINDVRDLDEATAQAIFAVSYFNALRGPELPAGVDLITTDFGYNVGVVRSGRCLQQCLGFAGADVDGWVGQQTLEAVRAMAAISLVGKLAAAHLAFYAGETPEQRALYLHGWDNRVIASQAAAMALIRPAHASAPVQVHGGGPKPVTADDLNQAQLDKPSS